VCASNTGKPHLPAEWSISIVDDDARVRKSLVNLLSAVGYHAVGFDSGEAFMASLTETLPDCVLLDSRMGGMQGIDVQRLLKSMAARPAIVCMSAFWDNAGIAEAHALGAHRCLPKPFEEEQLLSTLKEALTGRRD